MEQELKNYYKNEFEKLTLDEMQPEKLENLLSTKHVPQIENILSKNNFSEAKFKLLLSGGILIGGPMAAYTLNKIAEYGGPEPMDCLFTASAVVTAGLSVLGAGGLIISAGVNMYRGFKHKSRAKELEIYLLV